MKTLSLWSVVIAILVFAAGCGNGDKKEPSAAGGQTGNSVKPQDAVPAPDNSPAARSLRGTPAPGGDSSTVEDPEYADRPPAIPPVPKSKLLDSIGRALINGAQKVGGGENE